MKISKFFVVTVLFMVSFGVADVYAQQLPPPPKPPHAPPPPPRPPRHPKLRIHKPHIKIKLPPPPPPPPHP